MKDKSANVKKAWALALGALWILGMAGGVFAQEKVKISIGHLVHLTGAYAAGQAGSNEGFMDAIWSANKYNYVPGVELVGTWADGATDVSKSMAAFKKMVAETPSPVVIVGESTNVGLALKKWHQSQKVADVEGGSDDEFYRLPSWVFSALSPYVNEMGAWVDYYLKNIWPQKGQNRPPRFAWLTWDNAYGRASITDNTKKFLKSKGVEIVGEEFIPLVPTDVTPQLIRLKEKGADFTFGGMYHTALAVVLKDMDKLGMIDQLDVGIAYAIVPQALIAASGTLAKNVYITGVVWDEALWKEKAPKANEAYEANQRQKFIKLSWASGFFKSAIAVEAVRLAAQSTGPKKVDGEAVYHALQQMKKFELWGLGPSVTYTEKKRYGQDDIVLMRIKDKQVHTLGMVPCPNLTLHRWE